MLKEWFGGQPGSNLILHQYDRLTPEIGRFARIAGGELPRRRPAGLIPGRAGGGAVGPCAIIHSFQSHGMGVAMGTSGESSGRGGA